MQTITVAGVFLVIGLVIGGLVEGVLGYDKGYEQGRSDERREFWQRNHETRREINDKRSGGK